MLQSQVPNIQTVQKTVEVLETQHLDGVVNVSVVLQSQVPTIQTVQKKVEVLETQHLDGLVDVTSCVAKPSTNHPDSTEDDGDSRDSVF